MYLFKILPLHRHNWTAIEVINANYNPENIKTESFIHYLRNCIASEHEVMRGVMRDVKRHEVQIALHLVNHCICKREGLLVLHAGASFFSDHGVDLLLHLL